VNDSPYAERVVAVIDQPNNPDAPNMERLRNTLGDRLYELDAPTIEDYIPEEVYVCAGRSKDDDRAALAHASGNRAAVNALKREISTEIASALTNEDFDSIPIIVDAAQRAIDLST
jgi:hypothetical protein